MKGLLLDILTLSQYSQGPPNDPFILISPTPSHTVKNTLLVEILSPKQSPLQRKCEHWDYQIIVLGFNL